MGRSAFGNNAFDPAMCPLLAGLTPDEQKKAMETNPMIRACIHSVEAGQDYPHQCRTPPRPQAGTSPARGKRQRPVLETET